MSRRYGLQGENRPVILSKSHIACPSIYDLATSIVPKSLLVFTPTQNLQNSKKFQYEISLSIEYPKPPGTSAYIHFCVAIRVVLVSLSTYGQSTPNGQL
jgi:hypothetical protein